MKKLWKRLTAVLVCALMCLQIVPALGMEALDVGASGENVIKMQNRLAELGYYFAKSDGSYGKMSVAAIQRFQSANGLEVDGVASVATLEALYADTAIAADSESCSGREDCTRSIAVEADETVVYTGKTIGVKAEVTALTEEAPSSTSVKWFSANSEIATVDSQGQIRGVKVGSVRIYAYAADDERICKSVEIEVRAAAKGIEIEEKKLSLLIGKSEETAQATLHCIITPEDAYDRSVSWTSSDESIVTVDENGFVQAHTFGTATITATPGDPSLEKTATCEVTVSRSVDEVTISSQSAMIYSTDSLELTAQALPEEATNKDILWESSDPEIATVSSSGVVKGKKAGTVTITASAADGSGQSAACEVQVIHAVSKIAIASERKELVLGASETAAQQQLTVQFTPEDAHYQEVIWTSSDPQVATVSEDGLVQALTDGKVTITATTTDPESTATASVELTVGSAVSSIVLSDTQKNIQKGKTYTLTATVGPDTALNKDLVWSSSNEYAASVNASGRVTANATGVANITATAADGSGVSASCQIKVVQMVTKVSPSKSKYVQHAGKDVKLSATVAPIDATDKGLNWSSDNSSVASVDGTGLVTCKQAGTAKITATAKDGSGKYCTFTVVVEPKVPLTLDSIGYGVYQYNLLGLTVTNQCSTKAIVDFDFDMKMVDYRGNVINSGSYSLGENETIYAGSTRTIKRSVYGAGQAYKTTITITGVEFSDGSFYSIPKLDRETWTFTRN